MCKFASVFLLVAILAAAQQTQVPKFDFSGITNPAGEVGAITPGAVYTIKGNNLAIYSVQADYSNPSTPLPYSLGGVTVSVNGVMCNLLYVSPQQINFVTPYLAPGNNAAIVVNNNGMASEPVKVFVHEASPALFQDAGGDPIVLSALPPYAAVDYVNPLPASSPGFVALLGTAFGMFDNPLPPGIAPTGEWLPKPKGVLSWTFDGQVQPGETVLFVGAAPKRFATVQVNLQVPAAGPGRHTLDLYFNGKKLKTAFLYMK